MNVPAPNLEEIVAGGPAVWKECAPRQLLRAFKRSGAGAGRPFLRFMKETKTWLEAAGEDLHEYSRRQSWFTSVRDDFLGSINGGEWQALIEHESNLAICADLIRHLVGTVVRSDLHQALVSFETRLCNARTNESTPPADRNEWASHVRYAIEARIDSFSESAAVGWLAQFLEALGPQGMEASLCANFQRGARPLALALTLVPGAPGVFAAIWRERGSAALAQMVRLLGQEIAQGIAVTDSQLDVAMGIRRPSELQIRRFVTGVATELHRTSPQESAYFRAWFDTAAEGHVVAAGVFVAYLDATPNNHEDVFELLTTRREGPRRSPGLSITVSTSMRIRAGHSFGGAEIFTPPDFDLNSVLRRLRVDSAVALVVQQPLPEYLLTYLTMMHRAGHPQMEEIVRRTFGHRDVLDRLGSATASNAALLLDGLEDLASHSPAAAAAAALFPSLLALVPDGQIGVSPISDLARQIGRTSMYLRHVLRRIDSAASLRGIVELAHAGQHMGCSVDRFAGRVAIAPLSREITDGVGHYPWFDAMASLAGQAPTLATRILADLAADRLFHVYDRQTGFGVVAGDADTVARQRLMFKTLVARRMCELDGVRAANAFETHGERDFLQWFASGPSYIGTGPSEDTLGHIRVRWLEVVASASPVLAHRYIESLLNHATPAPSARPTLEASIEFFIAWQRARGVLDQRELHEVLRERIAAARERGEEIGLVRTVIDRTLVHFKCSPLPSEPVPD